MQHPTGSKEGGIMVKVSSDISMSLDGFITGPNEGIGKPLGDDGDRLHGWMFDAKTDADTQVLDEVYPTTGAILMGKRMFDVGVKPWGDPPALPDAGIRADPQVTRAPAKAGWHDLHLCDGGLEAGLEQARAAAGDKNVGIWGARTS
jgi:dihydrofolate reductase